MKPNRFQRVQDVVLAACELPEDRQTAFIRDACADDGELEAEALSLLQHMAHSGGALHARSFEEVVTAAADAVADDLIAESDGHAVAGSIGRYRVIRCIGRGGMGTVYEAEQENPRRVVALKIVRPGVTSDRILRRFRHEAQILGQLQHPNIAQIYEAGVSDTTVPSGTLGQPFFAMEFIRGTPIDVHVRREVLDQPARLALFAAVCDGVHYAHGKGVIHRDLKPGNILINEFGQPKILDFGIARVTNSDVKATIQTEVGQIVGTLGYMSPEQVTGRPEELDIRSDVYALGVILYELVSGRPPYDVRDRTIPEAARIIREEEPTRLSSIDPHLRGDVETIVAKALEKDRTRRYASAAALAADLRHYLRDEPIVARPASTFYQIRKFARRHRGLVGGACATVLTLTLGLIGTLWFAIGESKQRQLSDQRAHEARRMAYRASLGAAQAGIENSNYAMAAAALADAPEGLRGWEWHYLEWALTRGRRELDFPAEYLNDVQFLPDGVRIMAGGADGILRVIDPETGDIEREVKAADDSIFRIACSPDGRWVALITGREGYVVHAENGQPVMRFPEKPHDLGTQCFSTDGRLIGVGLPLRRQIEVYDVESGRCVKSLPISERIRELGAVCLQPGGKLLAARIGISTHIFDLENEKELRHHEGWFQQFVLGGRAVLVTGNHFVRTRDVLTGEIRDGVDCPPGRAFVNAHADPDGNTHCLVDSSRAWTRRDPANNQDLAKWLDEENPLSVTVGRHVVSLHAVEGSAERALHLWDARVPDAPCIIASQGGIGTISACGELAARENWGYITLWDLQTQRERAGIMAHRKSVQDLQFSPGSRWLASVSQEPELAIIDVENSRLHRRITGICHNMTAVAWDASGSRVFAACDGSDICVIDAGSWTVVQRIPADGRTASRMSLGPGDRLLLVCDELKRPAGSARKTEIWICDVPSGRTVFNISAGPGHYRCAEFIPNTNQVLVGTGRGTAEVWDIDSNQRVREFSGSDQPIHTLALHPDGSRIAAGAGTDAITIWDWQTSELLFSLKSVANGPCALRFNAAGSTLVVCAGRGILGLYESGPQPPAVYEQREINARATRITGWSGSFRLGADILRQIEQDSTLPSAIRDRAIEIARGRDDHVNVLNSVAWDTVRAPSRSEQEYREALHLAEGACRVWEGHPAFMNTLGIAQFRVGDLAAARKTLEACTKVYASPDAAQPSDWLFLAMIEHREDRVPEARACFERARSLMEQPSFIMDSEHMSFLQEARSALGIK